MTDFNVVPLNEPPYCRGIYKTFSGGWLKTKIARGSQRFLSVPFSKMRRFYFTTVSVYGSDAQTRVAIIDENGARQQLRRVFVKYRFPFLTQRADTGAYKSVHFKYGFAASTVTKAVQIENIHGAYPVCLVAPVKAGDAPVTIDDVIRDLDQLETTPAPRPTHDLARLETALRDLRAQDETQDVLQSLVRLYCLYQVNHGQNFRNFEDWSNGEKSRGNADVVQPFKDRLDTITAPLSLGRHGYIPSFKNLDLNTVENDLFDLMATVSSFGVKPFLNSGTLLGYFRDGRPIPHDDDFDLGVLVDGKTEDEAVANWLSFIRALSVKQQIINKSGFVAMTLSNGVQVDLFPAWVTDGKFYIYPYCWADVGAESVLPLQTLTVRGRDFAIPADPDAVLAVNYGPNWRVPDPFWRFDYTVSRKRFGATMKKFKAT